MIHRESGFIPSRQTGQIMVLATLTLIPFVLLIAMVFNTGEQVIRKTRVQNAADAAAITQATWTARSLNVISMNNVAITQSFVISVVGSAIFPVLVDATRLAITEILKDIPIEIKECAEWTSRAASTPFPANIPIGIVALHQCAEAVARGVHFNNEIRKPLESYWADIGVTGNIITQLPKIISNAVKGGAPKIREFSEIANALAAMNEKMVTEFPQFTKKLASDVAQMNGLSDAPRLVTAYKADDQARKSKYLATGLPVIDTYASIPPIKQTGEKGTSLGQYKNFKEHGYRGGRGPYPVAIDRPSKELKELKRALAKNPLAGIFVGPNKKLIKDFDQIVKACWNLASVARIHPGGNCIAPINGAKITIYELDQDFASRLASGAGAGKFFSNPDDFSLVAFTRSARKGGVIAADRFANPPNVVFGYTQAEIYNDEYPDLYTQNWEARLRPTTLLEKDAGVRREIIKATVDFPVLNKMLKRLSNTEHQRLNAH